MILDADNNRINLKYIYIFLLALPQHVGSEFSLPGLNLRPCRGSTDLTTGLQEVPGEVIIERSLDYGSSSASISEVN